MKSIARLARLIQISFILFRYGLDELVFSLHLFRPLRFFIYFNQEEIVLVNKESLFSLTPCLDKLTSLIFY